MDAAGIQSIVRGVFVSALSRSFLQHRGKEPTEPISPAIVHSKKSPLRNGLSVIQAETQTVYGREANRGPRKELAAAVGRWWWWPRREGAVYVDTIGAPPGATEGFGGYGGGFDDGQCVRS
jgi:hypothetical protein